MLDVASLFIKQWSESDGSKIGGVIWTIGTDGMQFLTAADSGNAEAAAVSGTKLVGTIALTAGEVAGVRAAMVGNPIVAAGGIAITLSELSAHIYIDESARSGAVDGLVGTINGNFASAQAAQKQIDNLVSAKHDKGCK